MKKQKITLKGGEELDVYVSGVPGSTCFLYLQKLGLSVTIALPPDELFDLGVFIAKVARGYKNEKEV